MYIKIIILSPPKTCILRKTKKDKKTQRQKTLFSDYHAWKRNKRSGNESRTLVYCFTEAGYYTRTPHVVWGILSSCIFSAEFAFALVVNTNEKTTAATMLMSIFFALKFFVVITLIF